MSIPLLSTKIRATSWCVFDESSSHSINIVDFLLKTITARSQAMAKEKTGAYILDRCLPVPKPIKDLL